MVNGRSLSHRASTGIILLMFLSICLIDSFLFEATSLQWARRHYLNKISFHLASTRATHRATHHRSKFRSSDIPKGLWKRPPYSRATPGATSGLHLSSFRLRLRCRTSLRWFFCSRETFSDHYGPGVTWFIFITYSFETFNFTRFNHRHTILNVMTNLCKNC